MSELTRRAREVWPYSRTVTEMADALERVEKLRDGWLSMKRRTETVGLAAELSDALEGK